MSPNPPTDARWPSHAEFSGPVATGANALFAYLDDPARLSAHMGRRSWRMGGGRMDVSVDDGHGRAVGSHIVLEGRAFGLRLELDEVIVERKPPEAKSWETVGEPRLLVIGAYRMGFAIRPLGRGSMLRVFIDYASPGRGVSRWLGRIFGTAYARWCTRAMVTDAAAHFHSTAAPLAANPGPPAASG
jgi:hypothetical protein